MTLRERVRGQMPALDGLRGVAILLVLMHQFDLVASPHAIDLALDAGWIGVQLFFVLSGFLITGILLDTRDRPGYFRGFFIRRVLRIFPLYYAALVATLIAGNTSVWLWTYLSNFHQHPALPHFWSLAVEEQFYLVWPLVVWLAGRRRVIAIGGVMVIAAIAARVVIRARVGAEATYTWTPCRMDALAVGAMLAAFVRGDGAALLERSGVFVAGAAIALGGLLLGRLLRIGATMQLAGYTVIAAGFALVLVGALVSPAAERVLAWAPLRRIGAYSYGMYVIHFPLHVYVGLPLLRRIAPDGGTPAALGYLIVASAATFVAAAISYHVFERRFLALKDRLAPR